MNDGLVDSMIFMHYENGHQQAIDWWETRIEESWQLHLSMITCMERFKGIARSSGNRQDALSAFQSRIRRMRRERKFYRVLPVTKDVCRQAYNLIEQYCREHTPPTTRRSMEALICDMLIAATALRHGLVLFTQNLRDFEWIEDLRVERADYEIEEG